MKKCPFTIPNLFEGIFWPKSTSESGTPEEIQALESDTLRTNGNYGRATKIRGNELFVGEPGALGSIFVVGEVHYYTRADEGSDFVRQSGFFPTTQTNGGQFGSAIDYDGTRVAVGKPNVSRTVEVFTFTAGSETSEQVIQANTYTDSSSRFGRAVAIKGSHLLGGAPGQDLTESDQGGVEYWTESGGTWSFQQAFTMNATPNSGGQFGGGLCMVDDATAFITRVASGSLFVEKWTRSGSTWSYDSQFEVDDYDVASVTYNSIDTDGTNLIIGFPSHDDGGLGTNDYGAFAVYTQAGTKLTEVIGDVLNDRVGGGVSIDGDFAVVGSPGADPSSTSGAGEASVWQLNL